MLKVQLAKSRYKISQNVCDTRQKKVKKKKKKK